MRALSDGSSIMIGFGFRSLGSISCAPFWNMHRGQGAGVRHVRVVIVVIVVIIV